MIIIGCDFHTRFEQVAMLDTETGEVVEKRLEREDGEARRSYAALKEPALVGIESTGYTIWFGEMLTALGHELWVGDAPRLRASEVRQQNTGARGALRGHPREEPALSSPKCGGPRWLLGEMHGPGPPVGLQGCETEK